MMPLIRIGDRPVHARLHRRAPLGVVAAALLLVPVPGSRGAPRAQAVPIATPAAADSVATPLDTATLTIRGRKVFVFRAPIGALSASERALTARRRIDALAEGASPGIVTTRRVAEGALVLVDSHAMFTITPADVDTLRGERLETVEQETASRLREVVAAAREERSVPHLLRAAGLVALATLIFLAALRILRAARRFVLARLPAAAEARVNRLAVGGFTLVSSENLLLFARRLFDLAVWMAGLFLAYLWLAFALTRFAYTRPWGEALGGYLTTTVATLALGAAAAVPGLFTVVIILIATRWVARIVVGFFDAVEAGSVEVPWVHPETANPTKRIVVAMLWLFAIVVSYPYIPGSSTNVFKGVSVFAGLVLSLGSSGVVNQAMSGLVLMYSRALKPGDYVRLGETEGTVAALGMLSTQVRTPRGEVVTLPNAVVAGASVLNYSRAGAELLIHTGVTIGYDTPWRQVEAMLLAAAGRTSGIRTDPAPFVLKTALSDFYIEYQLRVAPELSEQRLRVLDALHANIIDLFNEYGVQIMSPHYEADPGKPAIVPRARWYAAPASGTPASTAPGADDGHHDLKIGPPAGSEPLA